MTDMLKKSEKINTSDAYVKSDNLTEKWKKGELPEGHYYVKDGENMIAEYLDGYFYNNGLPMTSFSGGVDEVLAEVPSYEEYLEMEGHCAAYSDINQWQKEEISAYKRLVAELEQENAQLKKWLEEYNALEVAKENTKLKELLKECRELLSDRKMYGINTSKTWNILVLISQVLGEE